MIKMTFGPFANLAQINHHLSGEGANKVFILHNKTPGHQNTRTTKHYGIISKHSDTESPGDQDTMAPQERNTPTPNLFCLMGQGFLRNE